MRDPVQPLSGVDVPAPCTYLCMQVRLWDRNCTRNERIALTPWAGGLRPNRLKTGLNWTIRPADGIRRPALLEPAGPDETVSSQDVHMVERPDLRHAIVDVAVRRTGRRGRAGQPLLSHQGPQDRSGARLRAAL